MNRIKNLHCCFWYSAELKSEVMQAEPVETKSTAGLKFSFLSFVSQNYFNQIRKCAITSICIPNFINRFGNVLFLEDQPNYKIYSFMRSKIHAV